MRVCISAEVYQESTYFRLLDQLLFLFEQEQHEWIIHNPDEVMESLWMENETGSRLGTTVFELLQAIIERSAFMSPTLPSTTLVHISTQKTTTVNCLPPTLALSFLQKPLTVIVENRFSDATFLKTLAKTYPYPKITKAIQKTWLVFDYAGGQGQIPKIIDDHQNKAFPPRLFVLVDSDKHFPTDEHKAQKVEACCLKYQVPYVILYKRAIENYLPDEVIINLPDDLQVIKTAYLSLTADQKDFYDLKKGFGGKGKIPNTQTDLFHNLPIKSNTFKALRNGFKSKGFNVNELYQGFTSNVVTKTNLQQRCKHQPNPNELTTLLDKIVSLL